MPSACDIPGVVFKNASAILLARVVDETGVVLTTADLSTVEYTVYQLDADDPDSEVAVSGHTANSLVVNTVVFDTLQDDLIWTVDDKGYNFKHTIDVSSAQAFDTAGLFYRVRYNLTPVSGQVIVVRFKLKAI